MNQKHRINYIPCVHYLLFLVYILFSSTIIYAYRPIPIAPLGFYSNDNKYKVLVNRMNELVAVNFSKSSKFKLINTSLLTRRLIQYNPQFSNSEDFLIQLDFRDKDKIKNLGEILNVALVAHGVINVYEQELFIQLSLYSTYSGKKVANTRYFTSEESYSKVAKYLVTSLLEDYEKRANLYYENVSEIFQSTLISANIAMTSECMLFLDSLYAEYPNNRNEDKIILMLSELNYRNKDYDSAIRYLQSLHQNYPKSSQLDKGYYLLVMSYLGKTQEKNQNQSFNIYGTDTIFTFFDKAKHYYRLLRTEFPTSSYTKKVKHALGN